MKQPTLMTEFICPDNDLDARLAGRLTNALLPMIPALAERDLPCINGSSSLLGLVALVYEEILKKAGHPVLCSSREERQDGKLGCFVLYLPLLGHDIYRPCLEALRWVVKAINTLLQGDLPATSDESFSGVIGRLQVVAPRGINTRRFIEEADRLDIPWRKVIANVYQFGLGSRSRLFDSSFTDSTSYIGSHIARDKSKTAQLLLSAGLPGARHAQVDDEQSAVKWAEQLGYPVVVKPADKDGGVGVSAGLTAESMVRKAYAQAREISSRILVEKHFEGNDYRIHVLQGEVYWIAHRQPGGVTGDGIHNIVELLAVINADPLRGPRGSNALLKIIELDEEALELLEAVGMDRDSVPEPEQFIRLRRAANVASGGYPVPALEGAHPDNLELAVRAAGLLRLDVAGIDLLIPDIRQSWMESGALICEINAQPQLSPTLPGYLLEKLVKGNGRIPFVVVLGAAPDWLRSCQEMLTAAGRCVGALWPEGVYLDGRKIMARPDHIFQGCEAILHDTRVDFVIFCLTDDRLMETGFPVDRFDTLVLVDPDAGMSADDLLKMKKFGRLLSELSTGEILVESDSQVWLPLLDTLPQSRVQQKQRAALPHFFAQHLEAFPL